MSHNKRCEIKGCGHKAITFKRVPCPIYTFDRHDRVIVHTSFHNLHLCRRCNEQYAAFKRESRAEHD